MSGSAKKKCCCAEGLQACCLPDGSCLDLPPAECVAMGGVPQGKGTECGPGSCVLQCPELKDCLANPVVLNCVISNVILWIGDTTSFDYWEIVIADVNIRRFNPNTCTWRVDTFNDFLTRLINLDCSIRPGTISATWVTNLSCAGGNWNLVFGIIPGGDNPPLVACYYLPSENDSPLGTYIACTPDGPCVAGDDCEEFEQPCTNQGSVVLS